MKEHSPLTLSDGDTYCVICGALLKIKGFPNGATYGQGPDYNCDEYRKITLTHSWIIINDEGAPDGFVSLKCKNCGMLVDTPDCIPPTAMIDCEEVIMRNALI